MKSLLFLSCLLLISFFLFVGFFHPIRELNQDLGRHLLTGNIILQSKTIPQVNLLSYTHPHFPFINTHWFSEVIFSIIVNAISFPGLMLLNLLLIFSSFIPLVLFSWKKTKNAFSILIVSFFYINVLFERTLIRPELFSFLFVSLFILILFKNREKFTRLLFILPLLQLLWVNMHIYFFIGIIITALFFIDELITERKKLYIFIQQKGPLPSQIIIIGLVLGGVFLVSFANPNGAQGALYPLSVFNNYGYAIEENQTVWFLWNYSQKSTVAFFAFSTLLLFFSLSFAKKQTKPIDWLLAITFTPIAFFAARNLPLFALATFISCTTAFSVATARLQTVFFSKSYALPFFLALSTGAFLFSAHFTIDKRGFGYDVYENGKNAVDFFVKQRLEGPIFNNFDNGSYLAYRLYPHQKVFVDGRPEAYPASFFQNIYIPMQEDQNLFEKLTDTYKFQTIIFSHTDQTPWAMNFLATITHNKKWAIVYLDDTYVILIRNNNKNEPLIKKHQVTEQKPSFTQNANTLSSLAFLIRFYKLAGWEKPQEILLQKMLTIDPTSCAALSTLSNLLQKRNNPAAPIFFQRYQTNCLH